MRLKGVFSESAALFQLALLLFFTLAGSLLSSLLTVFATGVFTGNIYQNPDALRLVQLISAVCMFLIPSFLVAWLCSLDYSKYLFIKSFPGPKVVLLTFVCMFLLSPFITLAGAINKSMKLPAFFEQLESWMMSMEQAAEELTGLLFAGGGWVSFLFNMFVVAIMAAITEEFFFRGTLQRIIGRWFTNHHLVIWIVAIFFSAIHMQFYGFIPRLLLGAFFGYLVFWSKNIWVPVLAHFCNNATAVIGMSDSRLKENEYISGNIPQSDWIPLTAVALAFLVFFYVCVKRLRKEFEEV